VKWISMRDIFLKRREIQQWLKSQEIQIEIFNGGGTGCIETSCKEDWLTEVTVGSGFLQSSLFDLYEDKLTKCAFIFGLQVTRFPGANMITCQSGGFIASGNVSPDKCPIPFLPKKLKSFDSEGFGEVQTPMTLPVGVTLKLGQPVFFRPAKAGEIAERFDEYLVKNQRNITRVKTYRGLGYNCF